jgi:hypothetical protein
MMLICERCQLLNFDMYDNEAALAYLIAVRGLNYQNTGLRYPSEA